VPLAIHFVSAESKKENGPPVPAHTGMPKATEYAGWGKLGSANGIRILPNWALSHRIFAFFAGFAII
jgi:hypothetical protein